MRIAMQIVSEIVMDHTSSNALHKLVTKYAQFHDPIYPDFIKQMKAENGILLSEFGKRKNLPKRTIEIGCGTARQSWLLKKSAKEFDVHGIEISPEMVEQGKRQGNGFISLGDGRNFSVSEPVGAAIYGANAVCYFLENEDLDNSLKCAFKSLCPNGLVLMDFLPAKTMIESFTSSKFSKQVFKVKDGQIIRFNESRLNLAKCVRWRWDATYVFQLSGTTSTDNDSVELRAFFPSEITEFLKCAGFRIVKMLGYDGECLEVLSDSKEYSSAVAIAEKALR